MPTCLVLMAIERQSNTRSRKEALFRALSRAWSRVWSPILFGANRAVSSGQAYADRWGVIRMEALQYEGQNLF